MNRIIEWRSEAFSIDKELPMKTLFINEFEQIKWQKLYTDNGRHD